MIKNNEINHISVCVCTYKRPKLLEALLIKLQEQVTNGEFDYSIVLVDNDKDQSARHIFENQWQKSRIPMKYYLEPRSGIPNARNRAIQSSCGNFIAFIDDDEFPMNDWLLNLFRTCCKFNADGVLGPVNPYFEETPPKWIIKGKLFERPSHITGMVLHWSETRCGNVLIRRGILNNNENQFSLKFRHSEDQDFFKRITGKGFKIIWCNEATVYETETRDRFKLSYFLRRALLRGNVSVKLRSRKCFGFLKSLAAFQIYTIALPVLLLLRRHLFIKYLIKDVEHIGILIAYFGFDVQKYLT